MNIYIQIIFAVPKNPTDPLNPNPGWHLSHDDVQSKRKRKKTNYSKK